MTAHDPGPDWAGGHLRSARHGDVYFSREGGLAESRAVFLEGCGLPGRWAGRAHFTVGELGFGTGLNMLALIDLWRRHRPAGGHLGLFSVEGFPLPVADAARALAAFPELADLAAALLAQWPKGARGFHRIQWPDHGVTLDLAILDAGEALSQWSGRADAWFLDGFAPALNPDMWSPDLMAAIAARSAPGARAATYSVARIVRDGLSAAGFTLNRKPGFGRKRERLEAELPGVAVNQSPPRRIAIIGAGIAGAALARAFRALGAGPRLFAQGPMASGNPAALVSPRLAAGSSAGAQLHAQAFRRAVDLVRQTAADAVLGTGALRILAGRGEPERGRATLDSGLFDPGSLQWLDAGATSARLGEVVTDEALWVADALVLRPQRLRAAWSGSAGLGGQPEARRIARIARAGPGGWQLFAEGGALLAEADCLVIAAGPGSAALTGLPLRPVRGQVTLAREEPGGAPASWGGYAIPTPGGVLFGATHGRDDPDPAVRAEDNDRNLDKLARMRPALAARLRGLPLDAVAGVRAASPDHQPLAGRIEDGLFILSGLGGRGFTLAPLLAEHVAACAMGAPSPLGASSAALVDPARLKRRVAPESGLGQIDAG